ncbi:peroxiredoxin family protein [Hydrogenispora ethanolica]|uniref:Peroxiredoxin family protein n=1 Tax=Hydrogenispora ethanolica TaxID=1082276 RepID=A0A4V2QBN8_HYDET|nr:DsrE/DsrF/DrsH-like family protein [Hydrogenispora ethanolica]TCL57112.1 peroxiredoxin family protein [Hydrogenispora ethanolica]
MPEAKPKLSMILFSGDFDKAMAALTLANGAAGQGMEVTIFFTFWGMNLLRRTTLESNRFLEALFKRMMPVGVEKIGLSKMNFGGVGPWLMKKLIRQKDGQTAADLFRMAMERQIHFVACEASLKLLGIRPDELIHYDHLQIAGVDQFLQNARESQISFFI